jgi:hypothetical protein
MNTALVLHLTAKNPAATAARTLLKTTLQTAPALSAITTILALAMVPTLLAMAFDARSFQGINVWIKPLKFEISLAIYTATLACFARWISDAARAARWFRVYVGVAIGAIALEMIWIGGAAAFGVASHFNRDSLFMITAYSIAGLGAVVLTSLSLVFGLLIARNRDTGLSPALHAAIWTGLVMTFILTLATAGYMSSQASHFVGGNLSDAEGWRLMGWATDGGDLRVAHFFATHSMHALPLAGLLAPIHLSKRGAMAFAAGAAILYALFIAYTLAEAISGRPFLFWLAN